MCCDPSAAPSWRALRALRRACPCWTPWAHAKRRCPAQDAPAARPRLAVLLLAPRGGGKATAARAAAAALGLHLVPFSGAELAAGGAAPDALRGAFEAARAYPPALLLLRHAGALAAPAAGAPGARPRQLCARAWGWLPAAGRTSPAGMLSAIRARAVHKAPRRGAAGTKGAE